MNKTYVSPAIAVSEATAKYPTMILISGRVDNPEVSDSKRRYGLDEDESGSSSESWGTMEKSRAFDPRGRICVDP